jgi:hypothetical protein
MWTCVWHISSSASRQLKPKRRFLPTEWPSSRLGRKSRTASLRRGTRTGPKRAVGKNCWPSCRRWESKTF